jgi:hypothetical protein
MINMLKCRVEQESDPKFLGKGDRYKIKTDLPYLTLILATHQASADPSKNSVLLT